VSGRRYERKLVRAFEDRGWKTLPSGSSGSGTDSDRPDLLVGKAGLPMPPLAIEAKSTRQDAYTVREGEADQLRRWSVSFDAEPVLAFYWVGPPGGNTSYGGWWFRPLAAVRRSPAENGSGGHHLRPRRADRAKWASLDDLDHGRLVPPHNSGEHE